MLLRLASSLVLLIATTAGIARADLDPGDLIFGDDDGLVSSVTPGSPFPSPFSRANEVGSARGIAVSASGEIFLSADKVVRIDPATGIPLLVSYDGSDQRMAIEADGHLIGIQMIGLQAVVNRIDPATGVKTQLSPPGDIGWPIGVAVAPNGDIFVTDGTGLAVYRIDPVTGVQTRISFWGSLIQPQGLDVEPDGSLVVAELLNDVVVRVDPSSGSQTLVASGGDILNPLDVCVAPNGDLWVVNGPGKLVRVDPVSGAQTLVSSGGLFAQPTSCEVEATGDVLVANGLGPSPVRVDPLTGAQTLVVATPALDPRRGLSLGKAGALYVTDPNWGALLEIDPATGRHELISSGGSLTTPVAAVAEAGGTVLVLDHAPPALVRIDPATGSQTPIASGAPLQAPSGLALDASGDALVADPASAAVYRIDVGSGSVSILSSAGAFSEPSGVAVEADGNVLVADPGAGALFSVDPSSGAQAVRASGAPLVAPSTVVVLVDGEIFVGDPGAGGVWRVHPVNGDLTGAGVGVPVMSLLSWQPECLDEVDNDGDGLIDGDDPGCDYPVQKDEDPECDNGLDDDADGLADFPQDPGCSSPPDDREFRLLGGDLVLQDGSGSISSSRLWRISPATWTPYAFAEIDHRDPFNSLRGVAMGTGPELYTFSNVAQAVMRVPFSGDTWSVLSAGGLLTSGRHLATTSAGNVLVAGSGPLFDMVHVRSSNGAQAFVIGNNLASPRGVAVEADDHIVFADTATLYRAEPYTLGQPPFDVLSAGGDLASIGQVAIEPGAGIVLADFSSGGSGAVIRIDPLDGSQTLLSPGFNAVGVTVGGDGTIFATTFSSVWRIEPWSGARTLVATMGSWLRDLSVVPDCIDDYDNDGDSLVDLADPDCADARDFFKRPDVDSDADGLPDFADNCIFEPNPDQIDSDGDFCGNACDADYNSDGFTGIPDFNLFRLGFGLPPGHPSYNPNLDHNGDSVIGIPDHNTFRLRVGGSAGPSGTTPGSLACP